MSRHGGAIRILSLEPLGLLTCYPLRATNQGLTDHFFHSLDGSWMDDSHLHVDAARLPKEFYLSGWKKFIHLMRPFQGLDG